MNDRRDDVRRRLAAANLEPTREAEVALELEQHLEDQFGPHPDVFAKLVDGGSSRYAEMRAAGRSHEEALAAKSIAPQSEAQSA
jgi:hypothetical protein